MKNRIFLLAILAIFSFSCEDDDSPIVTISPPAEVGPYETGFFVTNEGPFNGGFGAISHITEDLTTVENDIYQSVNADNLGNIVQSMAFSDDNAYVITNVSSRITVVNKGTFTEIARITDGLENPRNMVILDNTGYVTNWGDPSDATDDFIAVVDIVTNTVSSMISVGEGPEEIMLLGDTVYVAHQGGFGVNNIVSVISTATNEVTTTIDVGDVPNSLQVDSAGNLIVLAGGAPAFTGNETGGRLTVIDVADNTIVDAVQFATEQHPNFLNVVGDKAFYLLSGNVYETTSTNFEIGTEAVLSGVIFYNMTILPNGSLAGCNAGDFASNGTIDIYDLSTSTLIQSLNVGIIPGNIYPIL